MPVKSFLDQIGLSVFVDTEMASAPWPRDEVARGRGVGQVAMVLAQLAQAPAAPIGIPVATIGGTLAVVEGTRVVRYQAARDLSVSRVLWNGTAGAVLQDDEDFQVFVNLDQTEAVVELSDGRLIHMRGDPDRGIGIGELVLPVRLLVEVPAPPQNVIGAITDPWLANAVEFHLDLKDAWHNAVAAGVFLRLHPIDRGVSQRPTVAGSWPHQWVRSLSEAQRTTVRERAVARVDGLWGEMETLEQALDPEDPDWRAAVVSLCCRRDDLEGVRMLLNWTRSAGKLEDVLGPLDAAADRFVRSIPVVFHVDDEQLRRAAIVSPMSWWVRMDPTSAQP